ncbi:MAG: Nif3-like dinuclear metal center hexameric protein [Candidatus Sericytochromatia bacterium]|nr:Nif3-like dinuclear metal center hexameric protein [Candidatus Sericytochromatia bacterium]
MTAAFTIQTVIDVMARMAPPRLAENWDNVGLMVGHPGRPLGGVTVALDPTFEAVQAAIAQGSNLVVTHHPLLFKPPRSLDLRQEPGRTLEALIKADCALYSAHTNLDATTVNHALASRLGLQGRTLLHRNGEMPRYKLGIHVPIAQVSAVCEAAWEAGAGQEGDYHRAVYAWDSEGQFQAGPEAQPAVGSAGQDTRVHERRLEFVVPGDRLDAVRQAVLSAHPFEAPALDVLQLVGGGQAEGFGLVGDLEIATPLAAFAERVKADLGVSAVRYVGEGHRAVRRVAWLGGSGGDYWKEALAAGADVYITGEVRHHAALDALAAGLSFIEVGHVGSEQPVVPVLADLLRDALGGHVPVHALHQVDPFVVV